MCRHATITDIFYVAHKSLKSKAETYALLRNFISNMAIAAVDSDIIISALELDWVDFEDCVQYFTGESVDADYIITRNPNDFAGGDIVAILPEELLNIIAPE